MNKLLIVGTQAGQVVSGPGTFMGYVVEAIGRGSLEADVVFPHSVHRSRYGKRSFLRYIPSADRFYESFFGSWVIVSFFVYVHVRFFSKFDDYESIWFADRYSALFCIFDPILRKKCVVMINDDSRILRWSEIQMGRQFICLNSVKHFLFYKVEQIIALRARLVVTNSEYLTTCLISGYGLQARNVMRLYKAVDISVFRERPAPNLRRPDLRFLFIKNEWERGGLDILIEGLSLLDSQKFTLTIVGVDGPDEQIRIRKIVERFDLRTSVVFLGLIPREKVPELIRNADIFCVPSRKEALGVAFLESIASGLPTIGSSVGGIPEVLAHGEAGWLLPSLDGKGVASAVKEIVSLSDKELSRKLSNAVKHASNFSCDNMILEMIDISKFVGDCSRGGHNFGCNTI